VVGAGFGGLNAARALAGAPVRVTLVDRHNFHLFQPLLYQVATAGLGAGDIAPAVPPTFHGAGNVDFVLGTVVGLDRSARKLLLADGTTLPYDFLVLAAGAITSTFGVAGVAEHAFGLKSVLEAVRLRNQVLQQYERAAADPVLLDAGALTFVIVGGGPTGVELSGALCELQRVLREDYPHLDVGRTRVVLVEMTDRLLATFTPRSGDYARERLRTMGAEVRLETTVEEVTPSGVRLQGGEEIAAATVIWVAGVRPHPLTDGLGFEQARNGRVIVDRDLSVPGSPEVFVVGDVAGAVDRRGRPYPQVASVAIQQGRHAARQIRRRAAGRATRRFRYFDRGSMATIGRGAAVAELPLGIRFRGRLAWLAWLGLHLVELIGFRNRLTVLVNWSWNYLTWDQGVRAIIDEQP